MMQGGGGGGSAWSCRIQGTKKIDIYCISLVLKKIYFFLINILSDKHFSINTKLECKGLKLSLITEGLPHINIGNARNV